MQNASSKSKITMSTNTDETTKPEPSLTETPKQMELFEDHLLTREAMQKYKVVGQVFETYWLVEYDNSLYIIDMHAAHERVLYEKDFKIHENPGIHLTDDQPSYRTELKHAGSRASEHLHGSIYKDWIRD